MNPQAGQIDPCFDPNPQGMRPRAAPMPTARPTPPSKLTPVHRNESSSLTGSAHVVGSGFKRR